MHYLIDGYNLLFRINEDVDPLSSARLEIIESLAKQLSLRKIRATVIFDSHLENADLFPSRHYHGCLEIIYTPRAQTADHHILEKLSFVKHPKRVTVVTCDRFLATECKECGANVLSIDDFLVFLSKKKARSNSDQKESPQEIDRLRKIFERRLNTNDELQD